ncbi:hypothetical protein ES703_80344 [subsurface metagenome]
MDPSAVVLFHQIQGIPDNGQTPVSQDIDFYQPCIFHRVLFPLEHLETAGGDLHRTVPADFIGYHH